MLADQAQPGDLQIVERRRESCIFVSVPGRYALAEHRNARGERREFACRAVNISESEIALAAPVSGRLGERVIAHVDCLGRIEGAIIRNLSRGFVMSIAASEEERFRLIDKIEWIEKHKNHDVPDRRARGRFVPTAPYSRLLLADGMVMTCLVIDLSETGAAVSADLDPQLWTGLSGRTIVGPPGRHFG